jgi:hypothetical protein
MPPTDLSMALSNFLYDKLTWAPQQNVVGYTVKYKLTESPDWEMADVFSNFYENYNPKQAKVYQYQVLSRCSESRVSEPVGINRNNSIKPDFQPPTDVVVTQLDAPNTVKLAWAAVKEAKDYTINVKKGFL